MSGSDRSQPKKEVKKRQKPMGVRRGTNEKKPKPSRSPAERDARTTQPSHRSQAATTRHPRKAIAFNEAVMRTMVEGLYTVDRQGLVTSMNPAAERLFGWSLDELRGRKMHDVTHNRHRDGTPFPADECPGLQVLQRGSSLVEIEDVFIRKDGTFFDVVFSSSPIREEGRIAGLVVVFRDVTERKVAEEALCRSEERYRSLTGILTSVVWTMSTNGTFDVPQPEWQRFTGQTWEECQGEGWVNALHPADRDRVHDAWEQALRSQTIFRAEGRVCHAESGEYHACITQAVPLFHSNGSIREWIGNLHDINGQRQAEEERERLLTAERQAREDADLASRAKDEFLATVSHELRSPLNAILGWARLLASGGLSDENASRGLKAIERNAKSQAQLVEDLLDVSHIVTGKFRLSNEPVNLVRVIEAAVDSIRPTADLKSVRLEVVLNLNAGTIQGDPTRLQQVVWNLLSNAVKFTPADGLVRVSLARFDGYVEIVVSDTGKGIDPGFLPYVFDRFRQADSSITRSFGGLGLGLAIVRHIAELHGGTVTAESKGKDQGASFTLRVPVKDAQTTTQSERAAHVTHQEPTLRKFGTLKDVRILIVDDQPETLLLFDTVLTQCGARIRTASSADEGFTIVRAWLPQIIISDIGMPGEDGYSFMNRVRTWAQDAGIWIPAVALTGYAQQEDRLKVLASGFQMYLSKPVAPPDLINVLVNLVDHQA